MAEINETNEEKRARERRALLDSVRPRPSNIPRVHEGDPAARLPFFDVATLIAGTYPPEGAEDSHAEETEDDAS